MAFFFDKFGHREEVFAEHEELQCVKFSVFTEKSLEPHLCLYAGGKRTACESKKGVHVNFYCIIFTYILFGLNGNLLYVRRPTVSMGIVAVERKNNRKKSFNSHI